jgi:hypothetical protein
MAATSATPDAVAAARAPETLRFQAWQSAPDVSFWQKLAALKLDKFQLSDQPQNIVGYFSPGRSPTVPARLTVDDSAFVTATSGGDGPLPVDRARYEWKAHGVLHNTNTLEVRSPRLFVRGNFSHPVTFDDPLGFQGT